MPEMHLRQLGFTCCACESFSNNKERVKKKIKKQVTGDIFIKTI